MIQLRKAWIRFFGTNGNKGYSWEEMVAKWKQQLMTGASASSKQGGKRKKTRRKRKKKRKKTRRKRR